MTINQMREMIKAEQYETPDHNNYSEIQSYALVHIAESLELILSAIQDREK